MKTEKLITEKPKANDWFALGERVSFDYLENEIVADSNHIGSVKALKIWNRMVKASDADHRNCMTMMPGFPDGSFGWASTERYLAYTSKEPRLYLEYVGMGDSDKPEGYNYSVKERADMVEALWKYYDVRSTLLITFDFSSLVALELLSRQIDAKRLGKLPSTEIKKVLFINGGLFADSHSHPLMTTPLLKTSFGRMGAKMAQHSTFAFNMMMKDLWSKEYGITKAELAENHKAISRREGTVFMSNAAGFVDEHQSNAERWDLKRIFDKTYPDVKYIVAGSEKDQFEPRQVKKAKKELEPLGLRIEMYPGGHMTTSEHPDLIANTIEKLKTI